MPLKSITMFNFNKMKLAFGILTFALITGSCSTKSENRSSVSSKGGGGAVTTIQWQDTVKELGIIEAGKKYQISFACRNTGSVPLIFQKIESTCGCTVLDKKIDRPLLPNQVDSITGEFSMTETGPITRKIYVLANTERQFYVLKITADVR